MADAVYIPYIFVLFYLFSFYFVFVTYVCLCADFANEPEIIMHTRKKWPRVNETKRELRMITADRLLHRRRRHHYRIYGCGQCWWATSTHTRATTQTIRSIAAVKIKKNINLRMYSCVSVLPHKLKASEWWVCMYVYVCVWWGPTWNGGER